MPIKSKFRKNGLYYSFKEIANTMGYEYFTPSNHGMSLTDKKPILKNFNPKFKRLWYVKLKSETGVYRITKVLHDEYNIIYRLKKVANENSGFWSSVFEYKIARRITEKELVATKI